MTHDMYEEEATKILDAFMQKDTGYNAMVFYQFMLQYPEVHYNEVIRKMQTFSLSRE